MHLDGSGFMGVMWLWWILGVPLGIVVIWFFARGPQGGNPRQETPEETLKRRYASGEIDRDEYKRMLDELRN